MSLFKSRSGKGLFRFRAISGFIKTLFHRKNNEQKEQVSNNMKAKFTIQNEDK